MKTEKVENLPLVNGIFSNCAKLANKEYMAQATERSKWLIDNFLMRGSLNRFMPLQEWANHFYHLN